MAIMMGDSITNGALVGSVLFVGAGTVLAQDNNDFFWDVAGNKLKSKDRIDTDSSNFGVGSGNVSGNSSGNSGTTTIDTGSGSPNTGGSLPAGNSGAVTVITGVGGSSDNGSAPGNSGNLNLKTGSGGGNAFAGASGGNAGHIILQPGSGGSGPGGTGSGGSTIVRASNSGDIFSIQNNTGSTTHLAVSNAGNLRVGTASSTARLHLGAGTSTLPPLKLTAGTNLTTPQAGALEWDGSKLWITSGTLRKELTNTFVANVMDFGAKGDGTTDDAQAARDAVLSVRDTGGVVYFPPNKLYAIGSTVEIRSYYPIFIVSEMSTVAGFYNTTLGVGLSFGYIKPIANLANGIFHWFEPFGETLFSGMNGGGGAIGLVFADPPAAGANQGTKTLPNGAIFLQSALTCSVRNCGFWYLKGTAIRVIQSNICEIDNVKSQQCGDTADPVDPVFHFGDGTRKAGAWIRRLFSENQYAPHVKAETGSGVQLLDCYFEQIVSPGQNFCVGTIHSRGCAFNANTVTPLVLSGDFVELTDSTFDSASALQQPFITYSGNAGHFSGLRMRQGHVNQVSAITCGGQFNRFDDIVFSGTGNFDLGVNNMATGLYFLNCTTNDTHVLKLSSNSSLVNCNVINANANVSGILAAGITPRVIGCFVSGLSGTAAGIETANAGPLLVGNTVFGVGSGGEYKLAAGTNAWNNYPWHDALVYRNAAASGPVSNTTIETDFDKSYTIDADRLRAGSVIRIRGQAFVTSATGGGTLELRLKIGNAVIQTTGALTAGSSFVGHFDSTLTVRTIGSTGTIVGTTTYGLGTYDVVTPKIGFLGSTSINTTIAQVVKLSAQWSVADVGNSVRLDIFAVEILSSGDVG